METGKKYVYGRYSIDDQNRRNKQVDSCKEYIATHYGQKAAEEAIVYKAVAESGRVQESPVMREMLSKLNPGDIVFATNVDRMGKEPMDTDNLLKEHVENGVTFIFTKQKKNEEDGSFVVDSNTKWNNIYGAYSMGQMIVSAEENAPMEPTYDDMDIVLAMIQNTLEPDEYDPEAVWE